MSTVILVGETDGNGIKDVSQQVAGVAAGMGEVVGLVIGKNVLLSPILNWYSTNKRNISFLKQNKKNHEQYNFI